MRTMVKTRPPVDSGWTSLKPTEPTVMSVMYMASKTLPRSIRT